MAYYHGSFGSFPRGTVLHGRGAAYAADWQHTDFYAILEAHRPADHLAHQDAVFMVGAVDDVDLAGGHTAFCLEVQPEGAVTKHDLNWSSEISCLLSDGHAPDSPEVIAAAQAYWQGVTHPNESVWEYLAPAFIVLRCEPYDDFDEAVTAAPWGTSDPDAPSPRRRRTP